MAQPIITLTTDYGTADHLVAAMKGVILKINPDARIIERVQVEPSRLKADERECAVIVGLRERVPGRLGHYAHHDVALTRMEHLPGEAAPHITSVTVTGDDVVVAWAAVPGSINVGLVF